MWRDQIVAYIRERIVRPTVIVGNSLGGYSALAAGSLLGSEAAGVVLLNAAGQFSEEKKPPKGFMATATKTVGEIFLRNIVFQRILFENLRRSSTIRKTLKQVYFNTTNVDDSLVESIRKPSFDEGAFNVFTSVFNPGGPPGESLDQLFAKLSSPLLLLWGNKDPWMNTPVKRSIYAKYIPKSTKEIVLDAGHCPHDEVPDQVNSALINWMQSI